MLSYFLYLNSLPSVSDNPEKKPIVAFIINFDMITVKPRQECDVLCRSYVLQTQTGISSD